MVFQMGKAEVPTPTISSANLACSFLTLMMRRRCSSVPPAPNTACTNAFQISNCTPKALRNSLVFLAMTGLLLFLVVPHTQPPWLSLRLDYCEELKLI